MNIWGVTEARARFVRLQKKIFWIGGGTLVILAALLIFVPVDERVIASGSAWPANDTRLYAPEDGQLGIVHVRGGGKVGAGQSVISLDTTSHQESLASIEAQLRKAEADELLQLARADRTGKNALPAEFRHVREEVRAAEERTAQAVTELARARLLHEQGLLSTQQLEHARLDLDLAKIEESKLREKIAVLEGGLEESILDEADAALGSAKASLSALRVEQEHLQAGIERATLKSPRDGVVTLVTKRRPGERVNKGDILAHIAHGPVTRAELFAGQTQIHRVQPGQEVIMRSEAFDTMRHGYVQGRVSEVSLQPESREDSGPQGPLYRVVVAIESSPQPIAIGSTLEGKIILQRVPLWRLLFPQTRVENDE